MAELQRTDPQAAALSAQTVAPGLVIPTYLETNWHLSYFRALARLADCLVPAGELELVKSGADDLQCMIRGAGGILLGSAATAFADLDAIALADNATNYVFVTIANLIAGTATVNTTGFPDPLATPHIRLGTIATGTASIAAVSGLYAFEDITQYRSTSYLRVLGVGQDVEVVTAGVGAPNVLIAAEHGKTITNEGAGAKAYNTLPAASAGLTFEFYCQDADGIRVTAAAGDTIRINANACPAAGYVESTTVGSWLRLKAINAIEWVAMGSSGTWSVSA